ILAPIQTEHKNEILVDVLNRNRVASLFFRQHYGLCTRRGRPGLPEISRLEQLERQGYGLFPATIRLKAHVLLQECQWLLKLHTFGLLNNSFQPTDEIRIARTLWRQRG